MRASIRYLSAALGIFCSFSGAGHAAEAFEISPQRLQDLPKGKEADGIVGDFVLRNETVQALVSGNLPLRRANMSTFYGADGITPGCLYDLTYRAEHNDQLVIFAPSEQRGAVSYVRIVEHGPAEAVVETVATAALNHGLYKRHEYRLKDGEAGLEIRTTLRNESDKEISQDLADRWTVFPSSGFFRGYRWADAVDPAHRAGYAYECDRPPVSGHPAQVVKIGPGEERVVRRFLAVGHSPAEAVGIAAKRKGETASLQVKLTDSSGAAVATAAVAFKHGTETVVAYPDARGELSIPFPAGSYQVEITDHGRNPVTVPLELFAGGMGRIEQILSPAAGIAVAISDVQGRPIPCKVQFIGVGGTPSPNLGPENRAHGCRDQYHSENGRFKVALAPGRYRVVVTRGIEFSHIATEVEVPQGQMVAVQGQLKRLVDTTGWVSADYHNHSTPSGDNTCGTDDRIINLAAEQIEFAPTTEHNRLYDWQPHIEKLGLSRELSTVPGLELTGSGPHLNSFPFKPNPGLQDGGAPVWNRDPRVSAVLLKNHQGHNPERWIQINHPDLAENFIDRNGDGLADGGYLELGRLIDAVEVQNFIDSTLLASMPVRVYPGEAPGQEVVVPNREFLWLQLLNRGHRLVGMAVADAHSVHGNGVGGWRMYMPSKSDEPAEIDWRENSRYAKAGCSVLTTGPFLQVRTTEGIQPGGDARSPGGVTLQIKVQCTDWIDIDRVQILVNGRAKPEFNFTRSKQPEMFGSGVVKFDRQVRVPLSEDAHIIVVACSETMDLKLGYGTSDQASIRPFAFHNPIYVDEDGGGFQANGDMLDFPIVPKKYTVPEAKELIHRHQHAHGESHAH